MTLNLQDITEPESQLDRRKRKTRIAIENALLELMQYKPLSSISISELAEKADVNRKTFYNNYSSIDDVINCINVKISQHIFNALPDKITIHNEIEIYNLLLSLTTALEPHKEILRKMTQKERNLPFLEYFKDQVLPYVEHNLSSYHVDKALTPYINSYLISGLSALFYEWVNDKNLNAQQVALLCYNLTISCIKLDNYKDIHIEE